MPAATPGSPRTRLDNRAAVPPADTRIPPDQGGPVAERVRHALYAVLLEARKALPRDRMRTRRSVCAEAKRFWQDRWGNPPEEPALTDALHEALEHLVSMHWAQVGGPTGKRVQLTSAGKDRAERALLPS